MAEIDDLERRLNNFEQRLSKLEETVNGRLTTDRLDRRVEQLEQKVDGRRGLEGEIQDLKTRC